MNEIDIRINYVNGLLHKMNKEGLSSIEYRDLQKNLIEISQYYAGSYPVCETFNHDDQLLFISDTHIGSEYENLQFINDVYNFALENNIKTVIHLGDLIEGSIRQRNRHREDLSAEIDRAIKLIGQYGIDTRILLGNHDYSVINKYAYPELTSNFFQHPNVDILGLGKASLNWNGVFLGLSHDISGKLIGCYNRDFTKEAVLLEGHTHVYSVDTISREIKVPSLSNELRGGADYNHQKRLLSGMGVTLMTPFPSYTDFVVARKGCDGHILFEEFRKDNGRFASFDKSCLDTSHFQFKKVR